MFFSINGDRFRTANPELVNFVLDRDARYLPPSYRVFVYYNIEGGFRTSGVSGIWKGETGQTHVLSEMTFPPFGYLMSFNSKIPDDRLIEITHFSRYPYDKFDIMQMKLPVLPTHLAFPADYRTRTEIEDQAKQSSKDNNET